MIDERDIEWTETAYIKDEISRCDSFEELRDSILPIIKAQHEEWKSKISEILDSTGYTQQRFSELCGVSRVSVNKWCKGAVPKNRETFLRIGMAAGYDVPDVNRLLHRYGRYPGLYSKSLEDCICIYVISKGCEDPVREYNAILDKIKSGVLMSDAVRNAEEVSTVRFDEKLSEVKDDDELQKFINENIAIFTGAFHKLYAYIKANIYANYLDLDYAGSVHEISEIQGWSSSLKQCVSAINQSKWYPTRNKIISLALHLSMDHEQTDKMLALAHMEPLCGKNTFESAIMFVLDDAELNNMLDSASEDYDPDRLCGYAREVLKKLDLPEADEFLAELTEVDDAW